MKKIFLIFVLVFCLAAGFAETGYRGHEWYSLKSSFPKTGQMQFEDEVGLGTMDPLIYEKKILGIDNFLIFAFDTNTQEMIAAGYLIPVDKTGELKKQLTKKKTEIKKDYPFYEGRPSFDDKAIDNFFIFGDFYFYFRFPELDGSDKNGKWIITIYDYNDDTQCLIFENAVPGQTVVMYLPHEQDF